MLPEKESVCALATYPAFVADPRHASEETEAEINRLGYDLLGRRSVADAAITQYRESLRLDPSNDNATRRIEVHEGRRP